ncbi:MAG TPA: hypothetical protein VKY90_08655 [Candidatus Dormibacteraeota bacterium]|nr:hypothetical protein [Candidatus Dormibacteraeota bacterium]
MTPEGIGALDETGCLGDPIETCLGAPHRSSLRWGPLDGEPLKKGVASVGVPRQGCGTASEVERCRIGVLLTNATSRGHGLLDRRREPPGAR